MDFSYAERNARPVLENVTVLDPGAVIPRPGSSGANVLSVTNPDENGIYAGLEPSREPAGGEPGARRLYRKGFRTISWRGIDPNGDPLRYDVDARREGTDLWFLIRKEVEEPFCSFDTTALPDGRYRFRVTASDHLANPEPEALTATEETPIVVIDNTPPAMKVESAKVVGGETGDPPPRHRRSFSRREGGRRGKRRPLAAARVGRRRRRLYVRPIHLPGSQARKSRRPLDPRSRRRGELGGRVRRVPEGLPVIARRALAALAFAFLLTACGPAGKHPESVVQRRLEGEPRTLNPILATTDPENIVLSLVLRNLLEYDETLKLVPGLAESVTASADYRTFTVTLHPGLRWEDGSPVTAEDVATTIRILVDPKTPALSRKSYWDGFERVDVVGPRTARVVFREPYAERLGAFNLPLLPAADYAGKDVNTNPRNRNPLANGPYRIARWETGRTIELVRNTQYAGERPGPGRVFFRVVPENASAFQALLSGELHEMRVSYEQKTRLDGDPAAAARSLVFDELGYTYLAWKNDNPLFASPKVRRALTMLIDRATIARTLYGGLAVPASGPIPPGLWPYDPSIAPWPYDPSKAEALLDEAGFPKGPDGVRRRGGRPFAFTLLLGTGSELQRQIVEIVQQSYRKAGIEMTVRPMEWASFGAKVDEGDFEAAILAYSLDPNPDLAVYWHSSQRAPKGWNTVGYSNPEADALMDRLRTTFDREEARKLYGQLLRILHEDEPVTFLHNVKSRWGVSKRLENVRTSPLGLFLFWPGASAWKVGPGLAPL